MNKFLFAILFFTCSFAFGQDDDLYDHGLDQGRWQEIRDGIRYEGREDGPGREWTYESREEYEREVKRYEGGGGTGGSGEGSSNRNDGDGDSGREYEYPEYDPPEADMDYQMPSFSGLGVIGYILLGVVFVGLIALIFYLFVNTEKKGPKIKGQVIDIEEINPTEIPLTELQRLLQEALANEDYRGAVRIYFIFIVRDLAEKNWIRWEKEKTNFHYLKEMAGKEEYEDFNITVSYFEYIWYGKRELDAQKFEQVRPKFTRLLDKLGVK